MVEGSVLPGVASFLSKRGPAIPGRVGLPHRHVAEAPKDGRRQRPPRKRALRKPSKQVREPVKVRRPARQRRAVKPARPAHAAEYRTKRQLAKPELDADADKEKSGDEQEETFFITERGVARGDIEHEDLHARSIFELQAQLMVDFDFVDAQVTTPQSRPRLMIAQRSRAKKALGDLAKYCLDSKRSGEGVLNRIDKYNESKRIVIENDKQRTGDLLEQRFENVRATLEQRIAIMHHEFNATRIQVREFEKKISELNAEHRAHGMTNLNAERENAANEKIHRQRDCIKAAISDGKGHSSYRRILKHVLVRSRDEVKARNLRVRELEQNIASVEQSFQEAFSLRERMAVELASARSKYAIIATSMKSVSAERDRSLKKRQLAISTHEALADFIVSRENMRTDIRKKAKAEMPEYMRKLKQQIEKQRKTRIATIFAQLPLQLKRRYKIGTNSYSLMQINKRIDIINAKCNVSIAKPSDLVLRYAQIKEDQERLKGDAEGVEAALAIKQSAHRRLHKQLRDIENEFGSYEFVLRKGTQEDYYRKITLVSSHIKRLREKAQKVNLITGFLHQGIDGLTSKLAPLDGAVALGEDIGTVTSSRNGKPAAELEARRGGVEMLEKFRESISGLMKLCSQNQMGTDFLASTMMLSKSGPSEGSQHAAAREDSGDLFNGTPNPFAQSFIVANLLEIEPPPATRNVRVTSSSTPLQKYKAHMLKPRAAARKTGVESDSYEDENLDKPKPLIRGKSFRGRSAKFRSKKKRESALVKGRVVPLNRGKTMLSVYEKKTRRKASLVIPKTALNTDETTQVPDASARRENTGPITAMESARALLSGSKRRFSASFNGTVPNDGPKTMHGLMAVLGAKRKLSKKKLMEEEDSFARQRASVKQGSSRILLKRTSSMADTSMPPAESRSFRMTNLKLKSTRRKSSSMINNGAY